MGALLRREPFKFLVKLCCALALLPSRYIRRGFHLIVREAFRHGARVYRRMRQFLAYVFRNWVNNRVRRQWMCVFGSFHRTNNTCECHNRMLRNYKGVAHPNIYCFIGRTFAELKSEFDLILMKFVISYIVIELLHNTSNFLHLSLRCPSLIRRNCLRRCQGTWNWREARSEEEVVSNQKWLQSRNLASDLQNPPGNLEDAIMRYLRGAVQTFDNAYDNAIDDA